ncbi:MAG: hypothetical protein JKY80_01990 [Mariprofundaceae bacterium]|nr:hypothetical protein [Methylophaga sp.]MBL4759611.1 hypothetical protein [Mariprofundaceae bacterium]
MILLLIKAPTGLSLALATDAQGNITATMQEITMHKEMDAIAVEWGSEVGHTATDTLFRVVCRNTTLAKVEALITKYKLPLVILHAQDAYESPTGKTKIVKDAMGDTTMPIMQNVVHKQATKATILPFMADVVTYDMKTNKELTRKKATAITLPNCADMAAWTL